MPIIKRGDIWHYRKQIHKDIRSHMPDRYKGKTEIHRSLGAISKRDAKDAAEVYDEYFNAIINDCYATIGRGKQTTRDAIFRRLNAERGITDEHKTSPAPEPEPQQATIYKEQSKPIRARYSIKRAYDLYLDDTKPVETTVNHWNSSWRIFLSLTGLDWKDDISRVTKEICVRFKEDAKWLPARTNKTAFQNLSPKEMIEITKEDESLQRITAKSFNNHIAAISVVCGFAVKHSMMASNPISGLKKTEKKESTRQPYSRDDIKAIFSHPIFTETPKSQWDHFQWIAILGLMGLRMDEIGQLLIEDIKRFDDGTLYIAVRRENDLGEVCKKVKNDSSVRDIPIHKMILDAGFMEYHERLKNGGSQRLFPNLVPVYGVYTHSYSKWWGRQRDKFGIHAKTKVFHSFRHTFKTLCLYANIPTISHDRLTGHAKSRSASGEHRR